MAISTLPSPTSARLTQLQSLYDAGHFLDAHRATLDLAPLDHWQSTPALVLGGRLAARWGDTALSNRLHHRAHRENPECDDAFYYHALTIWHRHNSFEALRVVHERTAHHGDAPANQAQAHLWLLKGRLLGSFRDFTAAEDCFARAERHNPEDAWLWVERCGLRREQDRYEEALAAASRALELRAWYVPAVRASIELLQLLNRNDEALSLLEQAVERLQCPSFPQHLVLALEERERHAEIPATLDRAAELLPLADASHRRWLAARRCDAAYRLGRIDLALAAAKDVGPGYYAEIATRLAAPAPEIARRVQLRVEFVRQHHVTCAPATMAALCGYWKRAVDHLEIARAICYDGTPAHEERAWAERHGWVTREFRVTWESTVALIDRGCPFALVTVGLRSGHMQAVIGYDGRLGTLLIRDPYLRAVTEWLARETFEQHAANGPRGLVLVPPDEAARLDGLELPEADLYDHAYRFQRALVRHDRATAEEALKDLERAGPEHRLTLRLRYELAFYDSNPGQARAPLRALRERFPDDLNYQLDELQLLQQLGYTIEHSERLREFSRSRKAAAVFWREHAELLARDAREHSAALRLLRRALRRQPSDAQTLSALGSLLWNRRDFGLAAEVYRLAASVADKVEYHWSNYFSASRQVRAEEACLASLRQRFETWKERSSEPARTLFNSLEALDRTAEGFAMLHAAREARPDDGELLLFAASAHARYGEYARAEELMQAAATRAAPSAWRRAAAGIASYQCQHDVAQQHWQELLALNPADIRAHQAVARLLAIQHGRAAAIQHFSAACDAQPHLVPLRQCLIEWLRSEPPEAALPAIDALLQIDPVHAWALREKALIRRRLRQLSEALACAEEAMRIAPQVPASHGIRANVLFDLGRLAEARAGFEAGIRLSVDADWLYTELLDTCADFAARREAVAFLRSELSRQVSLDNAYLQYRRVARSLLSPEELRHDLETFWKTYPENWSTWSTLVTHLFEEGRLDEALERATEATRRFPLLPRIWLDLAAVQLRRGDADAEMLALEKALALNPSWGEVSRRLAAAHERALRLDQAEHVLRRAIASDPTDSTSHGCLADILHRLRRTADAIAALEHAIALAPDYSWAWSRLDDWSREHGEPDRAVRLAEKLTETRAGEMESWLRLVRLRPEQEHLEANLAALDRATALNPRDTDSHDLRGWLLARHRRYADALVACRPPIFGDNPPYVLQARAAWIENARGHREEAIQQMTAIVNAHPDYLWGWQRLSEWLWETKSFERMREAAEKWVWLAPHDPIAYGYLATAHQQAGRKKETKETLARALEADPTYEFGATELLHLHLEDGEIDAATRVLRHIETHFPPASALHATLHYQRARKDRKAAEAALLQVARLPDAARALPRAAELFFEWKWHDSVAATLSPLLSEPDACPEIGPLWVRAQANHSLWRTLWSLRKLTVTPGHRIPLDATLAKQLAFKKRRHLLAVFVWWRRHMLRSHTPSWAGVGYAFNEAGDHRRTLRWMHDWRERQREMEPWMFVNLVQSYYSRGKPGEARNALAQALQLPPDHTRDTLLVWEACECALAGDTPAAEAALGQMSTGDLDQYNRTLFVFTRSLVDVQRAAATGRRQALKDARKRLAEQVAAFPALLNAPALASFYRRTLRRLGVDGGSTWLRIRSRLPLYQSTGGSRQASSGGPAVSRDFPWWVIALFILFGVRSCANL